VCKLLIIILFIRLDVTFLVETHRFQQIIKAMQTTQQHLTRTNTTS